MYQIEIKVLKFFKILFLLLLNFQVFAQINLTQGLVMYLPFNGNTLDASGNNNNATNYGATLTTDKWGNANSAYHFDGISNYMDVIDNPTLHLKDSMTMCAMVKQVAYYNGFCYNSRILTKGADTDNGWYALNSAPGTTPITCYNTDTLHSKFQGDIGNTNANTSAFVNPNYTINLNQWYCLTATWDNTTVNVYLDGSLIYSYLRSSIGDNYLDLFIGKHPYPNYEYWWNGTIDEIRLYNRPLNIQEIDSLCNYKQALPTNSISPNFIDSTTFKDCKSATVQFTDKSTASNTTITSWNWNFGDGNSSTLQNPLHTYTLPGNYTVSLTVKDATGLSQTTTQTLSVSFVLVNFTTVSGTNFSCGGTAAQLHAAGAVSYSWSPCSYLSNCTDSTPTATPPITTTYVLTSTNTQGCIDVDTITVHVNEGEQAVFVPNCFSPNGDNINDCFMVRSYANFITFALHIYNRWGQEIFSTTDPTRCWYGENKNGLEGAEMGTYFYYLKATTDCGKVEKKGDITLIK